MEALAVVCNEKTCLHSAGLLQSTSSLVLAAPSTSLGIVGSSPKVPSSVASGFGTHSSGGPHCDHCDRDGHIEAHYSKKMRQQA